MRLDLVQKGSTHLTLDKSFLVDNFQLRSVPIGDEEFHSLMKNFMKEWPNIQRLEVDWIGSTSMDNLRYGIRSLEILKKLWNIPCANYVNISKISASPGRFSKREVTYRPDPAGVSTSSVYRRLYGTNQISWDNYNFLDNLLKVKKSFCCKCDMNDLKMCFCD